MAASSLLPAMLAVAGFFVVSGAPVMTTEMVPHDVTEEFKMATTEMTTAPETKKLPEIFKKYTMGLARETTVQLAADSTAEISASRGILSDILSVSRRSVDSTTGPSADHPEIDTGKPLSGHTDVFPGYPMDKAVPSPNGALHHGPVIYAPAHYVPAQALSPSRASKPTPGPAPAPTPVTISVTIQSPTPASAPLIVLPLHSSDFPKAPMNAKSLSKNWNQFVTNPLKKYYDRFLAYFPIKAIHSLLFENQFFDFKSLENYRADKVGFVTAMRKVFHAPEHQLKEIANFFDMMKTVLPPQLFGKARNLEDLRRQIKLHLSMHYPAFKFLAPETVAHYYFK